MKRKRRLWIIFPLAVLASGIGYIFVNRPKLDAQILTPLPPDVRFTPRSAFGQKAVVDIPWFSGKRLRFPEPTETPKGFKDSPDLSGYLTWVEPSPPTRMSFFQGPTLFSLSIWEVNGQKHEVPNGLLTDEYEELEYAPMPTVYGDKAVEFKVKWIHTHDVAGPTLGPLREMTIELPPNHRKAPILPVERVKVGRWTLVFTPTPLVGPTFLPQYTVDVEGAQHETLLIEIPQNPENLNNLIWTSGKQPTLTIRQTYPRKLITVREVEPITIRAKVGQGKALPGIGFPIYPVVSEDSKVLGQLREISPGLMSFQQDALESCYNILLDGKSLRSPTHTRGMTFIESAIVDENRQTKLNYKPGQSLIFTALRQVTKATAPNTFRSKVK